MEASSRLADILQRGFKLHQQGSCPDVSIKVVERLAKIVGDKVLQETANVAAAVSPEALAALVVISETL